jgi:hypothetical protein
MPKLPNSFAIERVQTGVRMERRLLKVLKALAEYKNMTLGDLLEGVVLHSFEGKTPFTGETLRKISELKDIYGLNLDATCRRRSLDTPVMCAPDIYICEQGILSLHSSECGARSERMLRTWENRIDTTRRSLWRTLRLFSNKSASAVTVVGGLRSLGTIPSFSIRVCYRSFILQSNLTRTWLVRFSCCLERESPK